VTPDSNPPATSAPDGFRPDLEGLRAVAVVLVLLYHAAVPGFAGGYVGVDVFFVLSGFLITGLLLRELRRTGSISLPNFYARRARRLLPASAIVLLVTVVASAVLLPPLRVPEVTADAASAALYVSNMRFAFQATDYLAAELSPSPILHFWSLSVEEQFYVFWPALVLLAARGRVDPTRRVALLAATISIVSFVLAVWLTTTNQPWAFFSLPSRAWELGLGAFLAIGAGHLGRIPERPAAVMAWAGLGLVALSGVVLSTATPFPGLAALLPTVGSALVITGGFNPGRYAPARWLSTAVPRFLGRISYSLYLWHWPLLILPAVALDMRLPWWARGGLVLVAIGLAAITQRWVEDPLRHGRWIGTLPRRNLAMAGALTLVVAVGSIGVGARAANALGGGPTGDVASDEQRLEEILSGLQLPPAPGSSAPSGSPPGSTPGVTTVPPEALPATVDVPVPAGLRPALDKARKDYPVPFDDGCHAKQDDVRSDHCEYGAAGARRTMVLYGDSHALAWFPALERIAKEDGWRLLVLTKSACQAADVAQWNTNYNRVYHECPTWRADTFARIAREQPELVIVTSARGFRVVDDAGNQLVGDEKTAAWREGMARTLGLLGDAADRVVLVADTPMSRTDPPECLSESLDSILACATPYELAVDPAWIEEERAAAASSGASFVDPTSWVCPSDPCPPVLGNFLVLKDPGHMTTYFAAAIAGRLGEALEAATARR